MTAGNIGGGFAGSGVRQDYKNISSVPPTSGVAALLHHSQGSQFQTTHEDDRHKRILIREKERERRRLGLSAPDNYGGSKDKIGQYPGLLAGRPANESFSLSRNQENLNFQMPLKLDQAQFLPQQPQMPSVPMYNPPQINPQPQFFEPQQISQFQQYGQQQIAPQQPPFYPQQTYLQQYMPPYGLPQPSFSPPPQGGFMPFQMPGQFGSFNIPPQQPPLNPQVQLTIPTFSPLGRAGGQPRQGGGNLSKSPPQIPIFIPDGVNQPQRETFFDKFGQPDSVASHLNGGQLTQQDKARKLREELEQQIQEKKKRQEEEKIEREKWEMKYGEASYNAQQAKQQQQNAPNPLPPANAFPANQQQFPLQSQATFQGNQQPQQQQNLNTSVNNGQPRQLPGGGTVVAHGAVPLESSSSPNRNHPSQLDAYKNELMIQIEEKRKIKELERKKKLEEDEREEQRVKKEMEEMQRKYQYEVNPDAQPPQLGQNDQQQQYQNDPNNNRSVDMQSQQNRGYNDYGNGGNRQPNNNSYDDMGGNDPNENFDQYQDPNVSINQRGGQYQQQNYSYQQNNNSYQQQRFIKQQSRKIHVNHPQIDWNEDPNVGPDSTPQAFESRFYVQEKDENQSQAQIQSNNNNYSQNNNNFQQNNNFQEGNRIDSFDNQGMPSQQQQRPNPEQHRQQNIKQSNNNNIGSRPARNEVYNQNQFPQSENNNYQNNDFNQQAPFFGNPPPQLNVPLPPPPPIDLMADFDPFKQKLQQQLQTFQKDILRMQHQQKSMMKNYHKEIETLQVKKQQIINDMKSEQDIQMKMQIQQLSTAIAQLSLKMSSNQAPPMRPQSYSPPPPNKSEIVAEVLQEIKNVLQPLQFAQPQYSQSQSPPQNFNEYQIPPQNPPQFQQNNPPSFMPQQQPPQFHSELPQQLQIKKANKSRSPKNSKYMPHQQYQNQSRQVAMNPQGTNTGGSSSQIQSQVSADIQLPSTTMMMPHVDLSPQQTIPFTNQQQQAAFRSSLPQSLMTVAEEEEMATPLRLSVHHQQQMVHQTQMIPHNGSLIIQQEIKAPSQAVENKPKVDINITMPNEKINKGSLIQQPNKVVEQKIKMEQQEVIEDALVQQKKRLKMTAQVNITIPHDQIGLHKNQLLEKAKEIHEHSNELEKLNNQVVPKRRGSSVMQMPMLEVLNEEAEQEGGQESERNKMQKSNRLEKNGLSIPISQNHNHGGGALSPGRKIVDVNISAPNEIHSHKSQLLEKAQQIHDNVLPTIPPHQSYDRSSLTTSQDKRRVNLVQDYNRQSSQLSQNPILEASEEDSESQASQNHRSQNQSLKLKKQKTNQSIKLLNVKAVQPSAAQIETPREDREKLMERIRQKNKNQEVEEGSKLNDAFVRVETPPQVAMKIDKQQRKSIGNSENNSNEGQNNNEQIQPVIRPPIINTRDIGTALPNKRRGISQIRSVPNTQTQPQTQIPKIPKAPSAIVQPNPLSPEEVNQDSQSQQQQLQLQNQLIDMRALDLSNEVLEQALDSVRKHLETKDSQTGKSSQMRSNKLNNQAVSEALDSIKQVQADLEARNIIGPNPIQRVSQRTKPTTPNEEIGLENRKQLISKAQAAAMNASQISQNYTQEEFYDQLQYSDANTQELPLQSEEQLNNIKEQFSAPPAIEQQIYSQQIQSPHINNPQYFQNIQDQALIQSQINMMNSNPYIQLNNNDLIRQSLEQQHQQMMNHYSPQLQQQIPQVFQGQPYLPQPEISIPNPPIIYQDGYGNYVNFAPDSFHMNEFYQQNPILSSSFQAIQRNPYQAQYPLNQHRPQQAQPDYDYNEEFQHMAKEDSRIPTPIGVLNQQNSGITPSSGKEETKTPPQGQVQNQAQKVISAQRSPIKPAQNSSPQTSKPQEVQYSMIIPADITEVKNVILPTESASDQSQVQVAPITQTKKVVQPMQVPPWRQHLAPPQIQQLPAQQQQSINQSPVKAVNQQAIPKDYKGYNTEETVQYRIEQQQNVLEQELLYDQLMQYERQHLAEVQEYMRQQQAAREKLIEPYNQAVAESQEGLPKQITFPDFTGFLYNKFLVNGPPVVYTPFVDIAPHQSQTSIPQNIQEPSPRTKFMMQMSSNPSYTLVSRDPSMLVPEPSQPPTQVLQSLATAPLKPKPKPPGLDDIVNATQLHIPHTPSHMMRPVTQAPPRRIEEEPNNLDEQKQFLAKIEQIQEIVGHYERIKKDVELERMIQEQIKNEEMSKDYLRNLKKVEMLVGEKDQMIVRKKPQEQEAFNIGDNSDEDLLSPQRQKMLAPPKIQQQSQNRVQSSQGIRQEPPSHLIKEVLPNEEETIQDMSQSIQPTMSPQQKLEIPTLTHGADADKSLFSRQLSEQLNFADGSSLNETNLVKTINLQQNQVPQPLELPEINSNRGQTGVKFLRDMLRQVPSIPSNNIIQSHSQSRNSKPPLPPAQSKSGLGYSSNLPNITPKSQDLNSSSYIPRHILNNPGIMLPPIRQASQHSSNREFDNTSTINLGNDDSQNYQMTKNLLQLKPLQRQSSSLSDLFQPLPQPQVEYKKEDPFSLRDRLKQTLQETGQILRNENISLLQKVQEAGKSIKPSFYEQGLPPIIDLAQRDLVHLSQPADYAPRLTEDPVMGNGQFSNYDIHNSHHYPGEPTSFSNNFQQWDVKRTLTKTTEDRYNIVRSSGTSDFNPYLNNELVREMMQLRSLQQQQISAQGVKRQNSLPKLPQAPSPPKSMTENEVRNSTKSLGQPPTVTLNKNPIPPVQKSSETLKIEDSQVANKKIDQASVASSMVETKALPQHFVQSPILEHHSEYSHNGFSSNYDDVSRLGDMNQEPIVYRVVEHIVESPKNLFGVTLDTKKEADQSTSNQPNNAEPAHVIDNLQNNNATLKSSSIGQSTIQPINLENQTQHQEGEEGDRTQQNVQNEKNISLEKETANVWVSKWFSSAAPDGKTSSSQNQLTPQ